MLGNYFQAIVWGNSSVLDILEMSRVIIPISLMPQTHSFQKKSRKKADKLCNGSNLYNKPSYTLSFIGKLIEIYHDCDRFMSITAANKFLQKVVIFCFHHLTNCKMSVLLDLSLNDP